MRLIRIMTDTMNTIPITIHFIINFLPDRCGDLPWLPTIICKYLCETKYTCISIRYDVFMHHARAILIVTGVLFLFFSYSPYWFWGSLQCWSSWGPIRKSLKKIVWQVHIWSLVMIPLSNTALLFTRPSRWRCIDFLPDVFWLSWGWYLFHKPAFRAPSPEWYRFTCLPLQCSQNYHLYQPNNGPHCDHTTETYAGKGPQGPHT